MSNSGIDGAEAYRLHFTEGKTWAEVGRALRCHARAAKSASWRYEQRSKHDPRPPATAPSAASAFTADGNTATLEYTGPIKNLSELIAAHGIDLTVWQVDGRVKHNTWTTPAKVGEKWTYFQNHQVTAYFVKRAPEPVGLAVQAVRAATPVPPVCIETLPITGSALILPDAHIGFRKAAHNAQLTPFHDRAALSIAVQIAQQAQPEFIVILGDWLDLPDWSDKFTREPEFYQTTQPAICEAHYWLAQLRAACPQAVIVLHEGNHEARFLKAILTHLPAAYGLQPVSVALPVLTLPYLLDLAGLDIHWHGDYPNDVTWMTETLLCGHGDIAQKPGATARALTAGEVSQIVGHIHRREVASRTLWTRQGARTVTAYSPGCLCRIDGAVPANRERQQWQQGLAWVDFAPAQQSVTLVEIERGAALFNRSAYVGSLSTAGLAAQFPAWRW